MAVTKRMRKGADGKRRTYYQAEVWIRGVRVDSRRCETAAEAHRWHDETKERFDKDGPPLASEVMTFEGCVKAYLESQDFTTLRKSSQQTRSLRYRHLQGTVISQVPMKELEARHVEMWLKELVTLPTAENKQRKSFEYELKLLSVVLNWYRNEHDPSFVVPIVRRHRKLTKFKQVAPRRPDFFMRPEEIQAWLEAFSTQRSKTCYYLAKFMVLTGCRLGEAAGLTWADIDLKMGIARIRSTLSWDHFSHAPYRQEGLAKNEESIRIVPLTSPVLDLLEEMKKARKHFALFTTNNGAYLKDNAIRKAFDRAFKRAQLDWSATRITRHTFATWTLVAGDGNIVDAQIALGHTRREQTEVYAKAIAGMRTEVYEKAATAMLSRDHVKNHVQGERS